MNLWFLCSLNETRILGSLKFKKKNVFLQVFDFFGIILKFVQINETQSESEEFLSNIFHSFFLISLQKSKIMIP